MTEEKKQKLKFERDMKVMMGYIHRHQQTNNIKKASHIPTVLIKLCHQFYHIIIDRIIEANGVKKYYIKWLGLPYLCCTYEPIEHIYDTGKIKEYENRNCVPVDTQVKHLDDTSFVKGMYGWYKTTDGYDANFINNPNMYKYQYELDKPNTYKNGRYLRDYQIIGLNWFIQKFYEGNNSILADESGLGKRIQLICFLEHLRRVNNIHAPHLIITSCSRLYHWKREIENWTDLNCVVYYDNDCKKAKISREIIRNHEFYYDKSKRIKRPKFNILLTTYDVAMIDIKWLQNICWFVCIFDEVNQLKSRVIQLAHLADLLSVDRRTLVTDTFTQNTRDELSNIFNLIEPNITEVNNNILQQHVLQRFKKTVSKET